MHCLYICIINPDFFRRKLNEPPKIESDKAEETIEGLDYKKGRFFLESFLSKGLLKKPPQKK
jgi:hypothetical protein